MRFIIIFGLAVFSLVKPAYAQLDEMIVTVRERSEVPGIILTKRGDFLFLKIRIENDTMEAELRESEFNQTIANIFSAARAAQDVELSVENDDVVLPLTEQNRKYRLFEGSCGRGNTSCTSIMLKTPIPEGKIDPETLSTRLETFAGDIEKIGRTSIIQSANVGISVVNINQYRPELISLIMKEINSIRESLGDGHKVKLTGIDQQVEYSRSGLLDVALFIPYTYSFLPDVRYSGRD